LALYRHTICHEMNCPAHKVGGADDHVHIACSLSHTETIAKLVSTIKANSSKWTKGKGPQYEKFAWQNGYGEFSIGQSQWDALRAYIGNQRDHHRRESFQDEFRKLLAKYQVGYDEQYVWD